MLVMRIEKLTRRAAEWIAVRWKLLRRGEIRHANPQEFLREARAVARLRV
jgi:hypothetical protein